MRMFTVASAVPGSTLARKPPPTIVGTKMLRTQPVEELAEAAGAQPVGQPPADRRAARRGDRAQPPRGLPLATRAQARR